MKKALLTLAFAAMAGIASAVSYTWNSSDGTFAGFKDTNGNVVTFSGNFSLTVSFTASYTSVPATLFQIMTANGKDKPGELRWNSNSLSDNKTNLGTYNAANSAYWKASGGDFSDTRLKNGTTGGTNTITFNFSGWNADSKTYANAVSYSVTFANGNTASDSFASGAVGFGLDAITWTQIDSGSGITITGMTLNATPVTEVPEPTVLALLAVGVAGLALRRRA